MESLLRERCVGGEWMLAAGASSVAEPLRGESLAAVADPMRTVMHAGPAVSPSALAGALAAALRPDECRDRAPSWLLSHQVASFRRALAALRSYRGAILADPVGSGKTYIALAVAAALNGRAATVCLVPAALLAQWRATAARLALPVVLVSHQQASRGRLPASASPLVLIDESHHFRHPGTRRYGVVAPWLIGRRALLITATPVVNRLVDLAHQLRLAVRDDALAPDGVPSLHLMLRSGAGHPALGRLVIAGAHAEPAGSRPTRSRVASMAPVEEDAECARLLALVEPLRLSTSAAITTLIRNSLLVAAASSPAALAAALRRYRALLRHARDAAASGQPIDRASLRRMTDGAEAQLVMWALLPGSDGPIELALDDLERLDDLIDAAARIARTDDAKFLRLRALLADGRRTLVFTARRETVHHIRRHLPAHAVAWCTGTRAGIGRETMPREAVLCWFGPHDAAGSLAGPRHLISTDAVAEGLDLQAVERVVHYDLPWTPMRLEQREGRAVRLGSSHAQVEVVTFNPPHPVERALRQGRIIAQKGRLPAAAGLGDRGASLWRWRATVAERLGNALTLPPAAVAAVRSTIAPGVLAGFALHGTRDGVPAMLGTSLVSIDRQGRWTDLPGEIEARLHDATRLPATSLDDRQLRLALGNVAAPVREHLDRARDRCWELGRRGPGARRLTERLQALVGAASRRRDGRALAALERALRFAVGGHTAGEEALVAELAELPDERLRGSLSHLPAPSPVWDLVEVRLIGLIVFSPA